MNARDFFKGELRICEVWQDFYRREWVREYRESMGLLREKQEIEFHLLISLIGNVLAAFGCAAVIVHLDTSILAKIVMFPCFIFLGALTFLRLVHIFQPVKFFRS